MAQSLRTPETLTENPNSDLSTQFRWFITGSTSSSSRYHTIFWPLPHPKSIQIHTGTQAHRDACVNVKESLN